jgi:hypothetical protein
MTSPSTKSLLYRLNNEEAVDIAVKELEDSILKHLDIDMEPGNNTIRKLFVICNDKEIEITTKQLILYLVATTWTNAEVKTPNLFGFGTNTLRVVINHAPLGFDSQSRKMMKKS